MKLDTRLTSSALTLALAAVVIPFTADWQLPLLNGVVVRWIENGQALWLLFGALFTAWYIRPLSRPEGAKQFGYGLLSGGWCYWVEAPVGGVTISLTSRVCCSERFQCY